MIKLGSLVLFLNVISANVFGTIDVIIKTPECVVFASDSRTTEPSTEVATDTYEKIAKVTNYVMAQTAGAAMPGSKNLRTTIQDFKWDFHIEDSASLTIDTLITIFQKYCKTQKSKGVNYSGFLISFAGPDAAGDIQYCDYWPDLDSVNFHKGYNSYNVYWKGSGNTLERMLFGMDSKINDLIISLISSYLSYLPFKSIIDLRNKYNLAVGNFSMISNNQVANWSLKDAIDNALFFVNATIMLDQICGGKYSIDQKSINPITGGRILLCYVTRDGVKWVMPPEY